MSKICSKQLKLVGGSVPRLRLLKILLPVLILLLATGCTGGDPTATPIPTSTPTPTPTVTPTPIPIPTHTPTPTLEGALPEELFLEITEPLDESIVSEAVIFVRGQTTPDAVISIDGQSVEVDVQGEFVAEVSLEPGPNILEIVASDLAGSQESILLSVIFIP